MSEGYNKDLDVCLAEKEIIGESGKGGFDVRICSYNNKEPKVQIQPFFYKQDNDENVKQYTKLGRISVEMFKKVAVAVKDMLDEIGQEDS